MGNFYIINVNIDAIDKNVYFRKIIGKT